MCFFYDKKVINGGNFVLFQLWKGKNTRIKLGEANVV